jgi:hypothetical protein
MEKKPNTDPAYWIVFIVVAIFAFLYSYEMFSGKSFGNLFESKSEKCKQEAQARAKSLRDKELQGLKLKENPTPQDLEEIERLEIQQKTSVVDREDYEYAYEDCMK